MLGNGTGSIITGQGSLLKTGLGLLNLELTNTYSGNTIVSNGILVLNFDGLATNSMVIIATNSVLGTNGVLTLNFAGGETNVVNELILGGVAITNGVHNATTDPLYLAGTGNLKVVYVPPVTVNPLPGPVQFSLSGSTLSLSWPTNLGWILQSPDQRADDRFGGQQQRVV